MRDRIKKWWNRTWSSWEQDVEVDWIYPPYLRIKRTSNDGLIEYKKIYR